MRQVAVRSRTSPDELVPADNAERPSLFRDAGGKNFHMG
jgi:hypothetical protein